MKRSSVRPEAGSLRRWHAERERALDLLSIDHATWEALSAIRQDFALAKSRADNEATLLFVDYAAEILTPPDPNAAETDWIDWTPAPDPQGDADRASFLHRYTRAKAASGLKTQRQVASAAGLSPTTVHAIEAGLIRPQFRTVEKLAAAFATPVTDLLNTIPGNGATSPSAHNNRQLPLSRAKAEKHATAPADRPSRRRITPSPARKRSA
jgi:transcriptional regulator with XRE-family HTH domain